MLKSRKWALLAGVMLVSLILSACQGQTVEVPVTVVVRETQVQVQTQVAVVTATAEPAPTEPKVMVVCMAQEPNSLIWSESALVTSAVLEAVQEPLVDSRTYEYQAVAIEKLPSFDDGDAGQDEVEVSDGDMVVDAATQEIVPLAAGVSLAQADGSVVEYDGSGSATTIQLWATWTLREGLTWEDGTPVTSADQLWAWEINSNPDFPTPKFLVERTASYEAVDERTTRWTGLPGYTDSTYFLNVTTPRPQHAYGNLSPTELLEDETVNRDPLAYGPFVVDEWVAGSHITLSKNPNYYRASEGLPKLDQLIYRFVPDTNQLIAQLASGECDMGTQDAAFEGSLPLIRQFESEGLMVPQLVAGTVFEHLDFNMMPVDSYNGFAGRVTNDDGTPIFANANIRHAIAHCLDKQAIVDQATNGAAVVQHVYMPSDHPLYAGDENITIYEFDPARGLELLAAEGWTDSDGDLVLDKNGEKFSFIHSTRTNPLRERVTQIVQAQLKENCMIETAIELYGGEYFSDGPDGLVFGRQYDLGEFAWLTGVEPPCDLYTITQIPNEENGWGSSNNTGWADETYSQTCNNALAALDEEQKAELHAEAQRLFSEAIPAIPLFARAKILVHSPNVTGVIMDPTNNSEMWNVENFDINTN